MAAVNMAAISMLLLTYVAVSMVSACVPPSCVYKEQRREDKWGKSRHVTSRRSVCVCVCVCVCVYDATGAWSALC